MWIQIISGSSGLKYILFSIVLGLIELNIKYLKWLNHYKQTTRSKCSLLANLLVFSCRSAPRQEPSSESEVILEILMPSLTLVTPGSQYGKSAIKQRRKSRWARETLMSGSLTGVKYVSLDVTGKQEACGEALGLVWIHVQFTWERRKEGEEIGWGQRG